MNRVVTESIGNARNFTLLGGRLQLKDGCLTLGDKDLLHENTSYYYISSLTSHDEFLKSLKQHYVGHGEVHVFDGASINYELKYIPVLKCGDKILTLNSEDDYFITDHFFEVPLCWNNNWNNMMVPVTDGCLQSNRTSLLPIKLSYKEISYLVPHLGLSLPPQLQIILLPFHVATITSKLHEYHVVQIALENSAQISDYPQFDDSTFSAVAHVFFLTALYGACAAFVLDNSDQIKPFIESYGRWWNNHLSVSGLREALNSYVPILGWLVGMILEFILLILLVILLAGIVPAIALVVPAIVASILAFSTIWIRRIYLRIKKIMLFNKAST